MSFMNKVKSGITEAGSKAKTAVEINKLKMQASAKQKEIEQHFEDIGRIVFLSAVDRIEESGEADYRSRIEDIVKLETEVADIAKQIKQLSNEKDCVCGKAAPLAARFCPSCGHTFAETD